MIHLSNERRDIINQQKQANGEKSLLGCFFFVNTEPLYI